jgi:hypothetical protein
MYGTLDIVPTDAARDLHEQVDILVILSPTSTEHDIRAQYLVSLFPR